ncbi:HbrB-domain-containing protein [Cubamyces sp. BRFM 1775]|nr:HbrB-domain-containing protein [Cubamyces sp. BRFM 1775]
MRTPERRRSSSQGDATPRGPAQYSNSLTPDNTNNANANSTNTGQQPNTTSDHPSKRLGFLGDILLSSAGSISVPSSAQRSSPIPHSLLPTRSHSRGDSALARDNASSPTPTMATSTGQPSKGHVSPSKASSTRTYDSKLVSREMHRLGNLAHLPSLALAPSLSLSATPSNITLAAHMAPGPGSSAASSVSALSAGGLAADNPWTSLHVLVLPLFNEEPLRVPIEDLNQLVKRHIQTVVSAAPGKAIAALENDTYELISAGMVTLNAKLAGVEDEKLILRVVELWTSFWTKVLPYLEGALLPLQTDPILSSLYRHPKARPASPTATQNGKGAGAGHILSTAATQIDVRALALVSFRDRIVLPLFPRLYARLTMSTSKEDNPLVGIEPHHARLQQMLLVLVSQRSQRLVSHSLTAPPPQPTAGEAALARLVRAMHAPLVSLARRHSFASTTTTGTATTSTVTSRTRPHAHAPPPLPLPLLQPAGAGGRRRGAPPSFLSAGLPRDRRGRIAQKSDTVSVGGERRYRYPSEDPYGDGDDGASDFWSDGRDGVGGSGVGIGADGQYVYWDGGETDTPRVAFADPGRERDKELLESLRSPDPDSANSRMSAHMGGWALGSGSGRPGDEDGYEHDEDEDDEDEEEEEGNLDWDSAQAVVERMVGMKSDAPLPPTPPAHIQQGQQTQMQAQPPASQQPSQPEMRRRQT